MKKMILLCLLFPLLTFSQKDTGMHFEHLNNWKEVLAKAKAENKYIFLDVYTTWCGPCKYMSANIFPLKEVGEFYNKNYINVKIQLDTTQQDNEWVKKWHQDGKELAKKYQIAAFPTYLYFNENGEIVHREVGASDAKTFIKKGEDAKIIEKQFYTQLRQFEKGNVDPAFLKRLATLAAEVYDYQIAEKVSHAYLATQDNLFTKENILFLSKFISKTTDKGFQFFLANMDKVDEILGKGEAEEQLKIIITQELVFPVIFDRNEKKVPDFLALANQLSSKYPKFAKELSSDAKLMYYQFKGDWSRFPMAVQEHIKLFGDKVNSRKLNSLAWAIFENCAETAYLTEALEWSKKTLTTNDPAYLDTYANLLHKLGRTQEAIEWEEKAILLLGNVGDRKEYDATLGKMKKGEKTWVEKK